MTIPFTFRGAILERNDAPLVIDEVRFEGPLLPGQAVVRIHYSGICGKQIEEITAARGPDPFLPHLLGHEGSGVVVETGPGVTKVSPGDKVVLHWMKGSGIDAETPWYTYARNGKRVNAGWVTTFNEMGVISENRLTPLPADADLRLACLLGCGVSTGIGTATREAALRPGESVAVFGCGGVGLNVVQGAALAGAWPIVAVDRRRACLEQAEAFGATHTVCAGDGDVTEQVRAVTDGAGANCVIVTAGSPAAIEAGAEASSIPGRVFVLGVPPAGSTVTFDAFAIHLKRSITGAIGGGITPECDIPGYWQLYRRGRIKLDELITAEVTLDDINDGIRQFMDGTLPGRAVVRMPHADA